MMTFESFSFNYDKNDKSKSFKIKILPDSKRELVVDSDFPKYKKFDRNIKQWKSNELLVQSGSFLYDVSSKPEIYFEEAHSIG